MQNTVPTQYAGRGKELIKPRENFGTRCLSRRNTNIEIRSCEKFVELKLYIYIELELKKTSQIDFFNFIKNLKPMVCCVRQFPLFPYFFKGYCKL